MAKSLQIDEIEEQTLEKFPPKMIDVFCLNPHSVNLWTETPHLGDIAFFDRPKAFEFCWDARCHPNLILGSFSPQI